MTEQIKTTIPFARAFGFILSDVNLTAGEKVVLIEICRYYPRPYWDSNKIIADSLGYTECTAEKYIKRLAEKRYIRRGYAHKKINGKLKTCRVIKLLKSPEPEPDNITIDWITDPPNGGGTDRTTAQGQTLQAEGDSPSNRNNLPLQSEVNAPPIGGPNRYKEREIEKKEWSSSLSLAKSSASPTKKKDKQPAAKISRNKKQQTLTPEELQAEKARQIKALDEAELMDNKIEVGS